jgi:hypothetical protein
MFRGVARPEIEGVARPEIEGVALPETEGVALPEMDGVARPEKPETDSRPDRRLEATEPGRGALPGPTVGDESFEYCRKSPHMGGHSK